VVVQKSGDDDPTTSEIDGFIKWHSPAFRIWRASTNSETFMETVEYLPGSSKFFEPMGSASVRMNTTTVGIYDTFGVTTSLGENYPNPFSNETTIPFVVAGDMKIDLSIFDLVGKKIRTLLNENLSSGSYTRVWNGMDDNNNRIKSGIYFCKMIAGKRVFVKTIIMK
jgi:hypothetical protein